MCGAFVQIWLCFLCFGDSVVRVLEIFFNCAFVWTLIGVRAVVIRVQV